LVEGGDGGVFGGTLLADAHPRQGVFTRAMSMSRGRRLAQVSQPAQYHTTLASGPGHEAQLHRADDLVGRKVHGPRHRAAGRALALIAGADILAAGTRYFVTETSDGFYGFVS
jgi:hypothetical protein